MWFAQPLPFDYHEPLFRPPSEAQSAIFQATLGCSHNQCTFCGMYKTKTFKIRPWAIVKNEITQYAETFPDVEKVFIADGDALVLSKSYWEKLLDHCGKTFSPLRRVTAYATPQNLLKKTPEQLKAICHAGLEMLYFGVESGDPETLAFVQKGATREEIISAAKKAHDAGFRLTCTALLGIAGKKNSQKHAQETASIFNEIQPAFIGILIWMEVPTADLLEQGGPEFQMIDEIDSLKEIRTIIQGLECKNTEFRSNHASNYLPLKGHLPEDKEALLAQLDFAIAHPEEAQLRPEWMRGT